ncbi:MAG: hypothetical protein Q7Q73_19515 [Verrucomicrobiota bacterium JB024]|nr:hypothetical protein [Verrucomicrobiota bacterium JB024]
MGTLSMDLRERILAAYDAGEGTREDIALRFRVSLGMVKKLLQLRRSGKGIEAGYARCGRKAMIQAVHRQRLRELLSESPDLTLEQLRTQLGLTVTVQAIHYALADMDLTYKKRRSAPASRTART